ncbi:MAG: TrkA family potassium uptake protein [candidate division WOR-3 bacterium]
MKQFVVIGLGRFGLSIARALSERNFEVLAIDRSEERIKEIEGMVSQAIVMDATDEKALKELGIKDFDTAIVSIGENIEDSIMITMLLKELGVKQVVAKAQTELHSKILQKVGADRIVFPEKETAEKIAETLVSPKIFDYIDLSTEYGILEIISPKKLCEKTLAEIKLREKYGISVIAIKRKVPFSKPDGSTDFKEEIIIGPGGSDEILPGDILVLLGKYKDLHRIEKL